MGATPSEGARGEPDPLTEWVDEFVRTLDEGRTVDLEGFVARAPGALRDELRERCIDVAFLRGVMPSAGGAPSSLGLASVLGFGELAALEKHARGPLDGEFGAHLFASHRAVLAQVSGERHSRAADGGERFRCAAETVAKLRHPNIVPVSAVGERSGIYYFVTERVEGPLLSDELGRVQARGFRDLPAASLGARDDAAYVARVCEIAAQLADALVEAHAHDVIHGDVKPHNVVLDRNGRPRLFDFGLSSVLLGPGTPATDRLLGSAHYMSPEWVGMRPGPIDHRTDVFSLGVVLYELLALARPFEAPSADERMYKLAFGEPPSVRRLNNAVTRDLEIIVLAALEKTPADRYASAADFAADLRHVLAHEAIAARRRSWLVRGWRKLAR